jgi:Family of unknown function (DUF6152)
MIAKPRQRLVFGVLALLVVGLSAGMSAHHSFAAEYDSKAPLTLTGVVTKVEWTNPHTYVYIDVKDEAGKTVNWAFEGYPPNTLKRTGFDRDVVQAGTTITTTGWHARDNSHRAAGREITLPDGKKVFLGPQAAQ